jgi:serine/threonine-protein phosphatase 2A activator
LIEVLDRVEALAKETPPVDNAASRFGNPAFRTFYDKVQQVRENDGFTEDQDYR